MSHYIWWVPTVVIFYALYVWASKNNNDAIGTWYTSKWFWITFAMGCCSFWTIVSRISKNLMFDALLYDLLIIIGGYTMLVCLGAASHFNKYQWIGMFLILIGFILVKLEGK